MKTEYPTYQKPYYTRSPKKSVYTSKKLVLNLNYINSSMLKHASRPSTKFIDETDVPLETINSVTNIQTDS